MAARHKIAEVPRREGRLPAARREWDREETGARRPVVQGERPDNPGKGRVLARVAGVGALIVGIVLIALVLFGGDKGYTYKLLFETGGQLVRGIRCWSAASRSDGRRHQAERSG